MAELRNTLLGPPLQTHGRTHNSSYSGMEIVRKFHVPKWSDFLSVQRALHGRVEGGTGNWTRTPPLRDTYIKTAYCNETQVDFAHPNSPTTIPSLSDKGAVTIKAQLENQEETLQKGTAGAVVTAHYRPLITAWRPSKSNKPDEDAELTGEDLQRVWDWMDPVFVPGVKLFPWPAGLHFAVDGKLLGLIDIKSKDIGTESASPLAVPVSSISIKRILVGEVPWGAIAQLGEVINEEDWPEKGSPPARGLGLVFPARTLKFIDADVTNMIDAEGVRWYEIVLNFTWLHAVTLTLHDEKGELVQGGGPVTWDHQFARPSGFPVGWYEVFRNGTLNLGGFSVEWTLPGQAQLLQEGNLHTHGNFDNLFKLNP